MKLVLASASPRRAEILERAGFSFEILPADIPEVRRENESPQEFVERLAREKAQASAKRIHEPAIVLGADTVVVVDREMLGKPRDAADAAGMLRKLSGRAHEVLTGIALLRLPEKSLVTSVESTSVFFTSLSESDIADYIATGEPFGKAGAYAIQERAGRFVERIEGDYFNVVGLPLARVSQLLWNFRDG